jgi:hypothetical protein
LRRLLYWVCKRKFVDQDSGKVLCKVSSKILTLVAGMEKEFEMKKINYKITLDSTFGELRAATKTRSDISLNGGCGKSFFETVLAFFAVAEAGGSVQAKLVRAQLNSLSDSSKKSFDTNSQESFDTINNALKSAHETCLEKQRHTYTFDEATYEMGWDIVAHHFPKLSSFISATRYRFFWTAYDYMPCSGDFGPSRYVEVELNGELRLQGKVSDVMNLAMRAKLFEMIPNGWCRNENYLDQRQLAKGRMMPQRKRSEKTVTV